jgi:cation:H+ antiporter
MIYFVAAFFRRREGKALEPIRLAEEHSVEVLATLPPLVYFVWIWYKGSLGVIDAAVLVAMYAAYLAILWRFPPQGEESLADAPRVSRWAYTQRGWRRPAAIALLFLGGGFLIYITAEPFLDSMLAVATTLGVSQFVFVQWVAPFISEFPEKVSAFHWARRVNTAPMALMNMLSSNINQWTVLAAMIPIVYSFSSGRPAALPFDGMQREEILLTVAQSFVAMLLLVRMRFEWWDALLLFVLWLAQFLEAGWRGEVTLLYGIWGAILVLSWVRELPTAPAVFWHLMRGRRREAEALVE